MNGITKIALSLSLIVLVTQSAPDMSSKQMTGTQATPFKERAKKTAKIAAYLVMIGGGILGLRCSAPKYEDACRKIERFRDDIKGLPSNIDIEPAHKGYYARLLAQYIKESTVTQYKFASLSLASIAFIASGLYCLINEICSISSQSNEPQISLDTNTKKTEQTA